MYSLLEMPEDVMRKITELLDFESIQRLRKTCHDLRNFLEDTLPDCKLQSIDMTIQFDEMRIFFRFGNREIQVHQKNNSDGCAISIFKENRCITKVLNGEDFMDIAFKNFKNVFVNQKSIVESFNWDYHFNCRQNPQNVVLKFSEGLGSVLNARKQKLQVKCFHCTVIDQDQVLDVLPHLDPNTLKYLDAANVRGSSEDLKVLEMKEIVHMKFWKNLEMFTTLNFVVDVPIEHFLHFKRANVGYRVVTAEMVMAVKENFLHSSNMNFFELRFEKSNAEEKLTELFGQSFKQFDGLQDTKRHWFFKIPNNYVNAHSLYIYKNCVFFSRVFLKKVPENARLIESE
ncbi:unnamed protein product [Caenorhabditis brenneri]